MATENVAAIGNSLNLHRLISNAGPRKPRMSEVIKESKDTLIHYQKRRLVRWAEHSRDHSIWPITTVGFSTYVSK